VARPQGINSFYNLLQESFIILFIIILSENLIYIFICMLCVYLMTLCNDIIKFALEQATKAQMGSISTVLLFL
jgi:hypothetical protein